MSERPLSDGCCLAQNVFDMRRPGSGWSLPPLLLFAHLVVLTACSGVSNSTVNPGGNGGTISVP
ncbi:MAG: hypothetical protein WAM79_13045 [Candidatus Sulfotelmatobacter sp.]